MGKKDIPSSNFQGGSHLSGKAGRKDRRTHWDAVYERTDTPQLGWYQESPEPSLRLIADCGLDRDSELLIVGAGATTLVDELLDLGYRHIIANDISAPALERLQQRLGEKMRKVHWVLDDLTQPVDLNSIGQVDLWHDRAVLHFFLEEREREAYVALLRKVVKRGGYAIIATFHLQGAAMCSGLPVYRYDEHMLAELLGGDFVLLRSFDHLYTMPSGDQREYVYTLFQRK